ncbi:MAG: sulfotransferase domain-containing protein [Patescibacteria group bacterium]
MNNHFIIISHRRSGTHLTIDSIINNFNLYKDKSYINIDRLRSDHKDVLTLENVEDDINKGPTIIKSHLLPCFNRYFFNDEEKQNFINKLFFEAKKIYVYRDGRDVMASLYNYFNTFDEDTQKKTFKQFLRSTSSTEQFINDVNHIEFWKLHIKSWMNINDKNIMFISYENLLNDYEETLKKIEKFLKIEINNNITDVRMKKGIWYKIKNRLPRNKNIKRTVVTFNRGKTKNYLKYFDQEDLIFFNKIVKNIQKKLDYKVT